MTRRRSRPLLPHELYSSFHSSQESSEGHTTSSFASSTSSQAFSSGGDFTVTHSSGDTSSRLDPVVITSAPPSRQCSIPASLRSSQHSRIDPSNEANILHSQREPESECEALPSEPVNDGAAIMDSQKTISSDHAGHIHEVQKTVLDGSVSTASSAPLRPLRRTPSSIRLSLSLDGKAQVVLGNGTTPSPPRHPTMPFKPAGRFVSLQRSKSAVALGSHAEALPSCPRRSAPGRSRDARTWEFYCDSEARNALTVQAEQEQKGSAIGMLSLIRSGSSSSNMPSARIGSHNPLQKSVSMKRKTINEVAAPRPKIARTASSVARLQMTEITSQSSSSKTKFVDSKSDSQHYVYQDPSGDSDKENWEPGTRSRDLERQEIHPIPEPEVGTQSRVLQENTRLPSHSMSLGNLLNRDNVHPRHRAKRTVNDLVNQYDKENIAVDGEVAKSMRRESLPEPEDELDCVQNLLSLSQGAWR